ncbi:MAG: glycosyltransferase [Planctomycetota bacterium]
MKIGYLTNQYPKATHSFIRREIAALEALGVEVERFTMRRAGPDLTDSLDLAEVARTHVLVNRGAPGVAADLLRGAAAQPVRFARALRRALRLGWRSDRGLLLHLAYLGEAERLRRLARRLGIEHIHAHFGTNPPACALLANALGGPSFSFTVHGPEEFDAPRALKLRAKIAAARFTAAVAEHGRSQLWRWCDPEDRDRIEVVRCGVDEVFLGRDPAPVPDVPRLLCVGRLCAQKGHFVLLRAAARLVAAGVELELVLAGDGELRAPIEALAGRLGLRDRVRILGWIGGERVRDEILAARALVLPSFAEGLPVVIMEALALGRPVVSTFVAGIPELVVPGESGWLVPAGDADALAAALREVLAAPVGRLGAMGAAGRRRVRERHDVRQEAARLRDLFARACAAARPGDPG